MNKLELDSLTEVQKNKAIIYLSAEDYSYDIAEAKTLLYGYDCDRNTWHVYQNATGEIFLYIYKGLSFSRTGEVLELTPIKELCVTNEGIGSYEELIPNKRLYPQYCDYTFCSFLKREGVHLPFTTYEMPKNDSIPFAGALI
jgi:hypothetical protein